MHAHQVIDLTREALRHSLLLAGPPLAAALLVALVIGALQTVTQMHEAVVSQIPRVVAILGVVFFVLPWLLTTWVTYARGVFSSLGGG